MFDDMQRAIRTYKFSYSLPLTIKNYIIKGSNKDRPYDNDKQVNRIPIHNKNRNSCWKLNDIKDYKVLFEDKYYDKRPYIDGAHVCMCWYTKGVCFTRYKISTTHVPITNPIISRKIDVYYQLYRQDPLGGGTVRIVRYNPLV